MISGVRLIRNYARSLTGKEKSGQSLESTDVVHDLVREVGRSPKSLFGTSAMPKTWEPCKPAATLHASEQVAPDGISIAIEETSAYPGDDPVAEAEVLPGNLIVCRATNSPYRFLWLHLEVPFWLPTAALYHLVIPGAGP